MWHILQKNFALAITRQESKHWNEVEHKTWVQNILQRVQYSAHIYIYIYIYMLYSSMAATELSLNLDK
jgi:hypothetical protein